MQYLLSVLLLSSFSVVLNLAHVNTALADSAQMPYAGSKSLSSGLSTASSGALTIVSGVLSVPVLIVGSAATDSEPSVNRCTACSSAFPIANEIITFDPTVNDVD